MVKRNLKNIAGQVMTNNSKNFEFSLTRQTIRPKTDYE